MHSDIVAKRLLELTGHLLYIFDDKHTQKIENVKGGDNG